MKRFFSKELNPYFIALIIFEVLLSFIYCYCYLAVKYHSLLAKYDVVLKGFLLLQLFILCQVMTAGDHTYFNPAFALTFTTYFVGLVRGGRISGISKDNASRYANCIWVTIPFPFVGALLAFLFFKITTICERSIIEAHGDIALHPEEETKEEEHEHK